MDLMLRTVNSYRPFRLLFTAPPVLFYHVLAVLQRGLSGLLLLFLIGCQPDTHLEKVDPEALFVHEVLPVLEAKCMSCHGRDADKVEGGLDLSNYENLLAGGNSGQPAIRPGKAHKSLLYQAVLRTDEKLAMPPKEGDRLSDLDLQIIHQWIESGAPWPSAARIADIQADTTWQFANRMKVRTSGGLDAAWDNRPYTKEQLWAYFPVQDYEVPQQHLDRAHDHPIDAFLQEKRAEHDLKTAPLATKRALLRRATIDLTGLPPTPEALADFLADEDPEAFAKVIDRLLNSPHYGEQAARRWLDVVRYADSDGFSNDYMRPNAWRYRDYVIRAFNQDKPYNQFIAEQIAGDEIDPDDPEMLIATGFLRMGPWEHTGMSVAAETRQFYLDDVTNIVGETFLATPLNCAKCHDHKYDPIPTRDYYRIQAVFATTQFAERPAPFLPAENIQLSNSEKDQIVAWIDEAKDQRQAYAEKEEAAAREWYRSRGMRYLPKRQRRKLPDDQQPPRYLGLSNDELGHRKVLQKKVQLLQRQLERFEPLAYAVYSGPDRVVHSARPMRMPEDLDGPVPRSHILTGGSVYAPAEAVEPGVLSIVHHLPQTLDTEIAGMDKVIIPSTIRNRRLAFARWLTDPQHPLVARVMVNRIWQSHFGRGLVKTPNNFGATGGQPSHPELLDWLARYFVEHDWSMKAVHRLIMTSQAYQLSSEHPNWAAIQQTDPDNQWLTHFSPRRMEAEELKDALLLLSGELNLQMGGFPVRPEINREVALQPRHTMGSIAPAYQPSRTPQERNRRSIYAETYRTLLDPDLEVFNKPGADLSCEGRSESTVTPQVFTLFNGENTRARALALAHRLQQDQSTLEARIARAMQWIWGREAGAKELAKAVAYTQKMEQYHQQQQPPQVVYPTSVRREMFEEMTGESFTYEESLSIYANYVSDLQPADVNASTRALADLITVFFNANEFVYVY